MNILKDWNYIIHVHVLFVNIKNSSLKERVLKGKTLGCPFKKILDKTRSKGYNQYVFK
jgi:hypothetical protein